MLKLSILCPSIRIEKIPKLYDSICNSFHDSFELIIVGPYQPIHLPVNVKFIQDWGSPVRAQQIALCHTEGEYISLAVDDGLFIKDALEKVFEQGVDDPISLKYIEGNDTIDFNHRSSIWMDNPSYYRLDYHLQAFKPYTPSDTVLFNFGIVSREIVFNMGGWDCQFESIALSQLDFAIRLNFAGYKVKLSHDVCLKCDWEPGDQGLHKPVHDAFMSDSNLYTKIYSDASCWDRINIDINNWKNSPERWVRRFGNV